MSTNFINIPFFQKNNYRGEIIQEVLIENVFM